MKLADVFSGAWLECMSGEYLRQKIQAIASQVDFRVSLAFWSDSSI
jgi:hypothetical protein